MLLLPFIPFPLLQLATLATLATASGQATNFNVSADVAQQYGCGSECQQILSVTNAADLSTVGADFDFDFYATASNFTSSKPGNLLKLQPLNSTNLNVKSGVSIFLFQYTSVDLDGSPVPATGFIAFPFSTPKSKQFPVVAFAHGTIGVSRGCAPSTSPNFFDYDSWSPIIERGYAIVATDYAGLGNNYTAHKYVSFAAHANDIYYSVLAAREIFPDSLTHEWVSVGHSQGGGAVWKLSEHPLVQDGSSGYLGTVALAPASKVFDMVLYSVDTILSLPTLHQYVVTGEMIMLAIGVKRVFPEYNYSSVGEGLKRRIPLVDVAQLCTLASMGLTIDLSASDLVVTSNIKSDPYFKKFQALNAPAQGARASKPMIVLQGLADTSVLPHSTIGAYDDSCSYGNNIQLSLYPALDHSPLVVASAPEWLQWIDNRFNGLAVPRNCINSTVVPFNLDLAKTPPEFDLSTF